ncbi:MAG: hypothetical protein DRH79_03965 [Candidatus Cloacimonadota bacterium]|nr:MAG: hypothetical protein DRH79_03965 [Candidatus Cloacimonadota bacterium]
MEEKYLKDFVIALVVIFLIVLVWKDLNLYSKVNQIPQESKYKKLALGERLLQQIQEIETSIKDRKNFVFTVTKDPLEQNLIVKTMKDLELQWKEEVESMVRLETTIVPESGEKQAVISYKGKTNMYQIGDKFTKGTITDIRSGEISYSSNGNSKILKVQKLPDKPEVIRQSTKSKNKKNREYNW